MDHAVRSYVAVGPGLEQLPKFCNVVHGPSECNRNGSMHQGLGAEQDFSSSCMLLAAVSESKCFLWSPESYVFKIMQAGDSQS